MITKTAFAGKLMRLFFGCKIFKVVVALGLIVPSTTGILQAQKVALVLSGGGARGAAHVGVIKALEEHQIPIDYIAGTSIGALVGAMYAAGYTPAEMENFFTSTELNRWATGEKNPDHFHFFKESDPDASWIAMDFDFGKPITRIALTSFVNSTEMNFSLMKLFAGASAAANYQFDSLFVPFRCVAADIEQNQAVILSSGDLASAVRASITFPLLFQPIRLDGKLLFDGGMYNNFPQDVAMDAFCPDFIIGSKVSGNYPSPDPRDIISQLQKMLMSDTDFHIDTTRGILIEPPVEKTGLMDFSAAEEMIRAGYEETLQYIHTLKEKVTRISPVDSVNYRREIFRNSISPYFIDSIKTEGFNHHEAQYIQNILLNKFQTVTIQEIEKGYYRIAADGYLETQMPTLTRNSITGNYVFDGNLEKNERFTLKFGGNLSSRLANTGFVELGYKYLFYQGLKLRSNIYFGRFYSSLLLGSRIESNSRRPYYLETNLVYNHFDYFRSRVYFVEDITPSYLLQNEHFGKLTAGFPTDAKSKVEWAVTAGSTDYRYYQSNIFHREDTADLTRFRFIHHGLRWEHNTLNRKQYPSAGSRFIGEAFLISGIEKFEPGTPGNNPDKLTLTHSHQWVKLRFSWINYFLRANRFRMGLHAEINLSSQNFFSNYTASMLSASAFQPIPESQTIFLPNYRAHNYSATGIIWIAEIRRNFEIRLENYLFQPHRQILRDNENLPYLSEPFEHRYWMGAASFVFHTILGPVSFSVNYFDNPEDQFYFALNIGYLIFNKRALD